MTYSSNLETQKTDACEATNATRAADTAIDHETPENDVHFCHHDSEGLWSESRKTGKRSRVCDLFEARVAAVEFVGLAKDSNQAKGVRIRFEVQADESDNLPTEAEVYYQLSLRKGSKLREAVEKILAKPLSNLAIKNGAWAGWIMGKRCIIAASPGIDHSVGRQVKFLNTFVFDSYGNGLF